MIIQSSDWWMHIRTRRCRGPRWRSAVWHWWLELCWCAPQSSWRAWHRYVWTARHERWWPEHGGGAWYTSPWPSSASCGIATETCPGRSRQPTRRMLSGGDCWATGRRGYFNDDQETPNKMSAKKRHLDSFTKLLKLYFWMHVIPSSTHKREADATSKQVMQISSTALYHWLITSSLDIPPGSWLV